MFHLNRIGPSATKPGVVSVMDFKKVTSLIGRNKGQVDFVLDSSNHVASQYISRLHARVVCQENNSYRLFDDSLNGIFINNTKIMGSVVLQEGDIVTFGHPYGVRLKPGVWARQPDSEYQFIFEKCNCENATHGKPTSVLEDRVNTHHSVFKTPLTSTIKVSPSHKDTNDKLSSTIRPNQAIKPCVSSASCIPSTTNDVVVSTNLPPTSTNLSPTLTNLSGKTLTEPNSNDISCESSDLTHDLPSKSVDGSSIIKQKENQETSDKSCESPHDSRSNSKSIYISSIQQNDGREISDSDKYKSGESLHSHQSQSVCVSNIQEKVGQETLDSPSDVKDNMVIEEASSFIHKCMTIIAGMSETLISTNSQRSDSTLQARLCSTSSFQIKENGESKEPSQDLKQKDSCLDETRVLDNSMDEFGDKNVSCSKKFAQFEFDATTNNVSTREETSPAFTTSTSTQFTPTLTESKAFALVCTTSTDLNTTVSSSSSDPFSSLTSSSSSLSLSSSSLSSSSSSSSSSCSILTPSQKVSYSENQDNKINVNDESCHNNVKSIENGNVYETSVCVNKTIEEQEKQPSTRFVTQKNTENIINTSFIEIPLCSRSGKDDAFTNKTNKTCDSSHTVPDATKNSTTTVTKNKHVCAESKSSTLTEHVGCVTRGRKRKQKQSCPCCVDNDPPNNKKSTSHNTPTPESNSKSKKRQRGSGKTLQDAPVGTHASRLTSATADPDVVYLLSESNGVICISDDEEDVSNNVSKKTKFGDGKNGENVNLVASNDDCIIIDEDNVKVSSGNQTNVRFEGNETMETAVVEQPNDVTQQIQDNLIFTQYTGADLTVGLSETVRENNDAVSVSIPGPVSSNEQKDLPQDPVTVALNLMQNSAETGDSNMTVKEVSSGNLTEEEKEEATKSMTSPTFKVISVDTSENKNPVATDQDQMKAVQDSSCEKLSGGVPFNPLNLNKELQGCAANSDRDAKIESECKPVIEGGKETLQVNSVRLSLDEDVKMKSEVGDDQTIQMQERVSISSPEHNEENLNDVKPPVRNEIVFMTESEGCSASTSILDRSDFTLKEEDEESASLEVEKSDLSQEKDELLPLKTEKNNCGANHMDDDDTLGSSDDEDKKPKVKDEETTHEQNTNTSHEVDSNVKHEMEDNKNSIQGNENVLLVTCNDVTSKNSTDALKHERQEDNVTHQTKTDDEDDDDDDDDDEDDYDVTPQIQIEFNDVIPEIQENNDLTPQIISDVTPQIHSIVTLQKKNDVTHKIQKDVTLQIQDDGYVRSKIDNHYVTPHRIQIEEDDVAPQTECFTQQIKYYDVAQEIQDNDVAQQIQDDDDVAQQLQDDVTQQNQDNDVTQQIQEHNVTQQKQDDDVTQQIQDDVTQQIQDNDVTQQLQDDVTQQNQDNDVTQQIEENDVTQQIQDDVTQQMQENDVTHQMQDDDVTQEIQDDDVTQQIHDDDVTQQIKDNDVTHQMQDDDVIQQIQDDDVTQHIKDNDVTQQIQDNDVTQHIQDDDVTQEIQDDDVTQHIKDDVTQQIQDNDVTQEIQDDDVTQEIQDDDVTQHIKDGDVTQQMQDDDVSEQIQDDDDVAQQKHDDCVTKQELNDVTHETPDSDVTLQVNNDVTSQPISKTEVTIGVCNDDVVGSTKHVVLGENTSFMTSTPTETSTTMECEILESHISPVAVTEKKNSVANEIYPEREQKFDKMVQSTSMLNEDDWPQILINANNKEESTCVDLEMDDEKGELDTSRTYEDIKAVRIRKEENGSDMHSAELAKEDRKANRAESHRSELNKEEKDGSENYSVGSVEKTASVSESETVHPPNVGQDNNDLVGVIQSNANIEQKEGVPISMLESDASEQCDATEIKHDAPEKKGLKKVRFEAITPTASRSVNYETEKNAIEHVETIDDLNESENESDDFDSNEETKLKEVSIWLKQLNKLMKSMKEEFGEYDSSSESERSGLLPSESQEFRLLNDESSSVNSPEHEEESETARDRMVLSDSQEFGVLNGENNQIDDTDTNHDFAELAKEDRKMNGSESHRSELDKEEKDGCVNHSVGSEEKTGLSESETVHPPNVGQENNDFVGVIQSNANIEQKEGVPISMLESDDLEQGDATELKYDTPEKCGKKGLKKVNFEAIVPIASCSANYEIEKNAIERVETIDDLNESENESEDFDSNEETEAERNERFAEIMKKAKQAYKRYWKVRYGSDFDSSDESERERDGLLPSESQEFGLLNGEGISVSAPEESEAARDRMVLSDSQEFGVLNGENNQIDDTDTNHDFAELAKEDRKMNGSESHRSELDKEEKDGCVNHSVGSEEKTGVSESETVYPPDVGQDNNDLLDVIQSNANIEQKEGVPISMLESDDLEQGDVTEIKYDTPEKCGKKGLKKVRFEVITPTASRSANYEIEKNAIEREETIDDLNESENESEDFDSNEETEAERNERFAEIMKKAKQAYKRYWKVRYGSDFDSSDESESERDGLLPSESQEFGLLNGEGISVSAPEESEAARVRMVLSDSQEFGVLNGENNQIDDTDTNHDFAELAKEDRKMNGSESHRSELDKEEKDGCVNHSVGSEEKTGVSESETVYPPNVGQNNNDLLDVIQSNANIEQKEGVPISMLESDDLEQGDVTEIKYDTPEKCGKKGLKKVRFEVITPTASRSANYEIEKNAIERVETIDDLNESENESEDFDSNEETEAERNERFAEIMKEEKQAYKRYLKVRYGSDFDSSDESESERDGLLPSESQEFGLVNGEGESTAARVRMVLSDSQEFGVLNGENNQIDDTDTNHDFAELAKEDRKMNGSESHRSELDKEEKDGCVNHSVGSEEKTGVSESETVYPPNVGQNNNDLLDVIQSNANIEQKEGVPISMLESDDLEQGDVTEIKYDTPEKKGLKKVRFEAITPTASRSVNYETEKNAIEHLETIDDLNESENESDDFDSNEETKLSILLKRLNKLMKSMKEVFGEYDSSSESERSGLLPSESQEFRLLNDESSSVNSPEHEEESETARDRMVLSDSQEFGVLNGENNQIDDTNHNGNVKDRLLFSESLECGLDNGEPENGGPTANVLNLQDRELRTEMAEQNLKNLGWEMKIRYFV